MHLLYAAFQDSQSKSEDIGVTDKKKKKNFHSSNLVNQPRDMWNRKHGKDKSALSKLVSLAKVNFALSKLVSLAKVNFACYKDERPSWYNVPYHIQKSHWQQ